MPTEFFVQRPAIEPTIYVYKLPGVQSHRGYVKVGYTERDVHTRIKEQMGASHVPYDLLYTESAMCEDGSVFMDHDVHAILERKGFKKLDIPDDNEWYNCSVGDVKAAIIELKTGIRTEASRTWTFKMRPEQQRAVMRTESYFIDAKKADPTRAPKFLWNAKMRFGKTFTAYELAKLMDMTRILILTFKPAVQDSWMEDLNSHIDFNGWQFISEASAKESIDVQYQNADKSKPIVCFGSFQDFLGKGKDGNIKPKNQWVNDTKWDLVIFDEYHFGAWRDNAKHLFEREDEDDIYDIDVSDEKENRDATSDFNETYLPISTKNYLFLSGTPFRALS